MSNNIIYSYGIINLNWSCPVCDTGLMDLIHKRKNRLTYNGIQKHYYGLNPKENYEKYLRGKSCLIYYKCNIKETKIRKFFNIKNALSIKEMIYWFCEYHKIQEIKNLKLKNDN
ncbi:hypothetical protein CL617_04825 [archaeon]|nr:hypothetical protein [archaeon]|tara:strand:+ start:4878 stop:5219 length:342 start_codon:yes stop_codon:yes gene_type:complete